jgi:rhodanese-related sulfurtransferase
MTRALRSLLIGGCWLVASAVPVAATHSLGPMPGVQLISADYVNGVLAAREPLTLIDVRPVKDYDISRLPQARSVPLSDLRTRYTEIPRVGLVILYCTCQPGEEWRAYELLQVRGYRNIAMLAGGFSEWTSRGYPLEAR